MTFEEFQNEATICVNCDELPVIEEEAKRLYFTEAEPRTKYICYCPRCRWLGQKSGRCKTPENAVKSWNKYNLDFFRRNPDGGY